MHKIQYGSVCSGIEAATAAWHPLGMKPTWFAEIEPFPSAVLAHHYPQVPNHGDMTRLAAKVLTGAIPAPDVLVGGTPCQAFSVAGMRAGLADPRGALTIKYVELADAIDHVRASRGDPECITVWENVPGVLSDRGNAFGCFLGALAGEDSELQPSGRRWTDAGCVYGPRRTVAWRILDAQYFGLAQRRRRVFVVASARRGFDPCEVLFEREGVRRDTAPRRGQGQDAAANPLRSADDGVDVDHARARRLIAFGGGNTRGPIDVAACLTAKGVRQDFEVETFAVHGTQDPSVLGELAHPLGRNSGQENAVLAFSCKDYGADAGDVSPTLRAMGHAGTHANAGGQVAIAVSLRGREGGGTIEAGDDVASCMRASSGGGDKPHALVSSRVRRLTPVECERLQGFPDDYTMIPYRGRVAGLCPDGPRYKAIGNSKAVPVVRWIGLRVLRQISSDRSVASDRQS